MAAPKIKLYRLSRDFTMDSLVRDSKTETNDELLPVFDKYVSISDVLANRVAVGILPNEDRYVEKLSPILVRSFDNDGISRLTASLVLLEDSSNSYSYSTSAMSNSSSYSGSDSISSSYSGSNSINSGIYFLRLSASDLSTLGNNFQIDFCMNEGVYPTIYSTNGTVVPDDGWRFDTFNGEMIIKAVGNWNYQKFSEIVFVNNSSSSGLGVYCSKYAPIYNGGNSYFSPYVFMLKDGVDPRFKENIVDGISVVSNHESEMVFFRKSSDYLLSDGDYFIYEDSGVIILSQAMINAVNRDNVVRDLYVSYVSLAYNGKKYKPTKRFAANFTNLVPQNQEDGTPGGHWFMGPDVFLGKKQYEPSSYENERGEVLTIGISPAYVEPGNYSISHRNGYVTFPAKVDSDPALNTADYAWNLDNLSYTKNGVYTKIGGTVHISHAHLCCIENVYSQVFEKYYSYDDIHGSNSFSISNSDLIELRSGDTVFKASEFDYRYPKSIGAPWVKRNSSYMPTRVYVTYKKYEELSNSYSGSGSGSIVGANYEVITEMKPKIITIPNYDELVVKTRM